MPVEAWMAACNDYYYATRDPLGASGDFTTAPEISQMYGEMIGAALADAWARAGRPKGVRYAELGPGRGTLAKDALRTARRYGLEPSIHFVEASTAPERFDDQIDRMFESLGLDAYRTTGRGCIAGVGQQVDQHLRQAL